MNIIENVIERVEAYRKTNQNPCKNYATKKSAEKATKKMAKIIIDNKMLKFIRQVKA